jgi:hypothetical protein
VLDYALRVRVDERVAGGRAARFDHDVTLGVFVLHGDAPLVCGSLQEDKGARYLWPPVLRR